MNNVLTDTIEKRFWNMGDLVSMFNEPPSRIRFWVNYFGIQTCRTNNNYRKFLREDVDKLSRIISYVREGYHLKAIKNKI